MRVFIVVVAVPAAVLTLAATSSATASNRRGSQWPDAVTHICARALLFEHRHEIGTRAGALAVARDIRASTKRRLRRIVALPIAPTQARIAARWLRVEWRLAQAYARTYIRIFEVIDADRTPSQREREPRLLNALLHAPDRLGHQAVRLQTMLQVPDCTGGHPESTQLAGQAP
jgi:hypothetical protein